MIKIKNHKDVKTLLIKDWRKSNFLENVEIPSICECMFLVGALTSLPHTSQQAEVLLDSPGLSLVNSNKTSIFLSSNISHALIYWMFTMCRAIYWALCTHLLFWIISILWGTYYHYHYYTLFIHESIDAHSKSRSGDSYPSISDPAELLCDAALWLSNISTPLVYWK